ncbi:hypothetical protein ACIQ9E_00100 [Streptomyces sp. NPDC094448]|uniref:hypothetical protein n=1 Tax=Streptomyces sp. NPDC094448 TaxID=3366063 RepID=UPI00380526C8
MAEPEETREEGPEVAAEQAAGPGKNAAEAFAEGSGDPSGNRFRAGEREGPDGSPPPSSSPLARAEHFIWLTARVLEQRRFAYHFLGGGADGVDAALSPYLNEDGGYGHALEPDLRGPVSQPLHTAHALRVLDSIGRCGGLRAERLCRYLTGVSTPEGALPAVHPSQRGYPAAPFVPITDDPPGSLLTTGPVVGLLHRNEVWHAWLFRATDFCWSVVESLEASHPYEVEAAVAFLHGVPDRARARRAADRLGRLVREQGLVVLDPDRSDEHPVSPGYAPGEHHFAYDYARVPESPARHWFTDEEIARSLDHLAAAQREDGGWPVNWRQWAPGTSLEARPLVTIEALRTLRAYGRSIG